MLFVESRQTENGSTSNGTSESNDGPSRKSIEELMNVILANEGDYVYILSLSGKIVQATSSKPELRKAYLLLSTKVVFYGLYYYTHMFLQDKIKLLSKPCWDIFRISECLKRF